MPWEGLLVISIHLFLKLFFTEYTGTVEKHKLCPELISNTDESGLSTVHDPLRIAAVKGSTQVGHMASGERAIIGCIKAHGHSNSAVLILPGNHSQNHTLISAPPGTHGTSDSTSW
jgi:hypothetical protein